MIPIDKKNLASLGALANEILWLTAIGSSTRKVANTYSAWSLGNYIEKDDYILERAEKILSDIRGNKEYCKLRYLHSIFTRDIDFINTYKNNADKDRTIKKEAREIVETILLTWGIQND